MRFHIKHTTQYAYSRPVFIEPHVVRLRPRSDMNQFLDRYQIEVTPKPAGCSEGLDVENNAFMQLWFDGLLEHLEIAITAEVHTSRTNPYNGLLADGMDRLPLCISRNLDMSLRPYLQPDEKLGPLDLETVGGLVKEVLNPAEGQTLKFLSLLTAQLHQSIKKENRTEPGIQTPHETLNTGKGACRDLTLVFMAACRQVGIPARFVSGYQEGNPDEPYRDLHAWAEVFLPGLGWRGFDPTHGLAVADRHVVVAAAALPENAAPVTGSFRGTDAASTLEHVITINTQ